MRINVINICWQALQGRFFQTGRVRLKTACCKWHDCTRRRQLKVRRSGIATTGRNQSNLRQCFSEMVIRPVIILKLSRWLPCRNGADIWGRAVQWEVGWVAWRGGRIQLVCVLWNRSCNLKSSSLPLSLERLPLNRGSFSDVLPRCCSPKRADHRQQGPGWAAPMRCMHPYRSVWDGLQHTVPCSLSAATAVMCLFLPALCAAAGMTSGCGQDGHHIPKGARPHGRGEWAAGSVQPRGRRAVSHRVTSGEWPTEWRAHGQRPWVTGGQCRW